MRHAKNKKKPHTLIWGIPNIKDLISFWQKASQGFHEIVKLCIHVKLSPVWRKEMR